MPLYRLYRFDVSGRIRSSDVVEAASDPDAMKLASERLGGASGELWLGQRLVFWLGPQAHTSGARRH